MALSQMSQCSRSVDNTLSHVVWFFIWSCVETGVLFKDPHGSLLTQNIIWFCDLLFREFINLLKKKKKATVVCIVHLISKLLEFLLDKNDFHMDMTDRWIVWLSLQKEVTSKAEKNSRWKEGHFIWLLSAEKQPIMFASSSSLQLPLKLRTRV